MKIFLLLSVILASFSVFCQKPSDYSYLIEIYPDENIVYLKNSDEYTMMVDKDSINYSHKSTSCFYCLKDKGGMYFRDDVESGYFRELKDIEAYSLAQIEGEDKYEKFKVKDFNEKKTISNSVFYDDIIQTSFEYNKLVKGSVGYLSYTHDIKLPHFPAMAYFLFKVPVLENQLKVTIDNRIDFSVYYRNMDSSDVEYKEEKGKKFTTYTWTKKNIDAFGDIEYSQNPSFFLPHIILSINSYTTENGKTINVLRNVSDLHSWYLSMIKTVEIKDDTEIKEVLSGITGENDDERTRVYKVFTWVQSNIKYIAMNDGLGGLIPNSPDLVMSRRYGDCKDMSMLIVEMLRQVGVEAHFAWIGTRDIPYKYDEIASPIVDNHMIAVYRDSITEENIFLDATNSYIEFGMPTGFIQGKQIMINDGDGYYIDTIPEVPALKNILCDSIKVNIDGNLLIGSGKLEFQGYPASNFRRNLNETGDEKYLRNFINRTTAKGTNRYNLIDFTLTFDNYNVDCNYTFDLDKYIRYNNDEIYVNLNLDKYMENFKSFESDRELAYERDFRETISLNVAFEIPYGYEVKYVPDNSSFKTDKFSYEISYEKTDTVIEYNLKLILDYLTLEKDDFGTFNETLKSLKNSYRENIILIKK